MATKTGNSYTTGTTTDSVEIPTASQEFLRATAYMLTAHMLSQFPAYSCVLSLWLLSVPVVSRVACPRYGARPAISWAQRGRAHEFRPSVSLSV